MASPPGLSAPLRSSTSMRAAIVVGPRRLEIVRTPRPDPGPGQIRVRIEGCGVCAASLSLWQGISSCAYPTRPGQGGREGWGIVDALGAGVSGLREGQRVAFLSRHAYAEFEVAEAAHAVALPQELGGSVFPGRTLGYAVNVLRRCGALEGRTVAVVGLGFLGMLVATLAAKEGARVAVLSRQPFALDVAREQGADLAVRLGSHADAAEAMLEATGGQGCDVVIEATGQEAPLELAGRLVRTRGLLAIAGDHRDGPRSVDLGDWIRRGLNVAITNEHDPERRLAGMRTAIALVREQRLDPTRLYSLDVPLEQLDQAFGALERRPEGFFKALVRMDVA